MNGALDPLSSGVSILSGSGCWGDIPLTELWVAWVSGPDGGVVAQMKKGKKPAKVPRGPMLNDFEALLLEGIEEIAAGLKEIVLVLEDKHANGLKLEEADEPPAV